MFHVLLCNSVWKLQEVSILVRYSTYHLHLFIRSYLWDWVGMAFVEYMEIRTNSDYFPVTNQLAAPGTKPQTVCRRCYISPTFSQSISGPRPHLWSPSITLRCIALVKTPLDEWSVRRSDVNLTTYSNHKPQTLSLTLHHHLRQTTLGRTPLDERLARYRSLYLTTHNTQTSTWKHTTLTTDKHQCPRRDTT
jgi:hypothetical protein